MTTKHSAEQNMANQAANRLARLKTVFTHGNEYFDRKEVVNRMTNWQRNQWAKAGYPQDLDTIESFIR